MSYIGKTPTPAPLTSSDITDGIITTTKIADDAATADKIANAVNSAITANTSKTTNATHSGEVTGSGALTIADNIVDEANLKVSNSAVNGYVLSAQSGNTGGMTWVEAGGGSLNKLVTTTLSSAASSIDFNATYINSTYKNYFLIGYVLPSSDSVTLRNRLYVNGSADASAQYGFGSASLNNSQYQTDNSNGHFQLNHTTCGNASGEGVTFHEYLHNPMSTAIATGVTGMVTFKNTSGNQEGSAFSGSKVSVQANNGISFLFNSGNIAAGSYITLYGITD